MQPVISVFFHHSPIISCSHKKRFPYFRHINSNSGLALISELWQYAGNLAKSMGWVLFQEWVHFCETMVLWLSVILLVYLLSKFSKQVASFSGTEKGEKEHLGMRLASNVLLDLLTVSQIHCWSYLFIRVKHWGSVLMCNCLLAGRATKRWGWLIRQDRVHLG